MAHDEVPVKIDKENLKTPTPTTGGALYALGHVGADYDLWLEVPGPSDDELVPNDATPLDVKPGSHFFTAKKKLNPGNDRSH
jgi:hypothetical protein